ncbi:hypothetical protein D3C71_1645140 [compost metagenome]
MAEHQRKRRIDQAQLEQHRIDEARAAQHNDPGIGAHDFAQEERRDGHDQDEKLDVAVSHPDQRIRQGVRDEQGEDRGFHAQAQGVDKGIDVDLLTHTGEIRQRQAADVQRTGNESAQAVLQHGRHGDADAQRDEAGRGYQPSPQGGTRIHG